MNACAHIGSTKTSTIVDEEHYQCSFPRSILISRIFALVSSFQVEALLHCLEQVSAPKSVETSSAVRHCHLRKGLVILFLFSGLSVFCGADDSHHCLR